MDGKKNDSGKPRWDLLPIEQLEYAVKVMTFGADKYEEENWKRVPDALKRYFAALMRHIVAWKKGEITDPESGLPHMAHALCCVLFIMWFNDNEVICK